MSYCISITSLENLSEESTLLIHYNILCTGTWHLAQLSTAYRNVCDVEWTIMYPNHQHPRHTDFPITVTNPSFPATFAWNYGGIQGISSENFDQYHSYITQLSIFNYDCYNTGEPIEPGLTGEIEATGEPTGYPGEETGGGGPGGGPTGPGGPGTPGVPGPGSPSYPENPNNGDGSNPAGIDVPPYNPGEPPFGQPSLPNTPGTGPGGTIIDNPNGTGRIIEEGQSPVRDIRGLNDRLGEIISRPSEVLPGAITNPNVIFQSSTRSVAIPSIPGTIGTQQPGTIDINTTTIDGGGTVNGGLSTSVLESRPVGTNPSNQISIPASNFNDYIDISVGAHEVIIGEPLLVSCLMVPPSDLSARMEVYLQDTVSSILIGATPYVNVSPSVPLTCGSSTYTNYFNIGPLILLCKVFCNEQVVGVKSLLISNIESINEGATQSAGVTNTEVPTTITNHGGMSVEPINVYIPNNQSVNLILSSPEVIDEVSAVLKTKYLSEDKYSLTFYNATSGGAPRTTFQSSMLSGNVSYLPEAAYSDSRYKINDSEVYISTHTVGLTKEIVPTNLLLLEIAPAQGNTIGDTEGSLFVVDGLTLRPITVTVGASTVTAELPYGSTQVGLIVHGYENGIFESMLTAETNPFGTVTWNTTLLPQYYYSIILPTKGILNPLSAAAYNARYLP